MTTYVYDIVFTVLDALGNPLPASDTEVDLRLPNGNFVPRTPSIDETLDTGMIWSYKFFGEGKRGILPATREQGTIRSEDSLPRKPGLLQHR